MPVHSGVKLEKVPENLKEVVKTTRAKFTESTNNASMLKAAKQLREGLADTESSQAIDEIIARLKDEGTITDDQSLWKFPISRFGNVNGNGRIYPRELWENVINNQRDVWQGSCGLCDHPVADDDPGEFKNSSIIWYDMMIDDANKLIWAIGSFVGTYGRLAQEIIEKGGKVGFSSSGFGELSLDGKTIDPDTFLIERPADIVTNPSQSVFGDFSNPHAKNTNIEYSKQGKVHESQDIKSKIIQERNMKVDAVNNTVKVQEVKAEAPKTGLSEIEKNIIMKYVENMTSEAEKIKKPTDRLLETNKILKMVKESGDAELRAKVEESLVKARTDLEKMIEHAVNLDQEFGGIDKLSENVKDIATQGILLNEQVKDYKILAEGLTQRNQALYRENSLLKTKLALKDRTIATKNLKENRAAVASGEKLDKMNESIDALKAENAKLKEANRSLNRGNRKLEEANGVLKTRLNAKTERVVELKESSKDLTKANEEIKSLKEANEGYKSMIDRLQKQNAALKESARDARKELVAYKEDQKMENHLEPAFESYVSDQLNFRENKGIEVENYWLTLKEQYGDKVLPYERQIRGAKTYREAFNNFLKYREAIDNSFGDYADARISENVTSKRQRESLLNDAGFNRFDESKLSIEEINALEYEDMKRKGFN